MNPLSRLCSRLWIVVLLAGLVFAGRTAAVNLARAAQLSDLAGGDALVADASSPTGYAGGERKLVLPELNHEAQHWIAQTQGLLAGGAWRLRHLDSDNAPVGRTTLTPSPYRWWLASLARLDHALTGRPLGQSVERAALYAGPALLALLLLSTTLYTARFFGGLAAALVAAGMTLGFPFAGNFLSPIPGDRALAQVFAVWTLLPLAAGFVGRRADRGQFVVAALAGAALLWCDAGAAVLVLGGVLPGGLAAAWWSRERRRADGSFYEATCFSGTGALPPWRMWAGVGAGATLLAWLAEYAPDHLGTWRLEYIHPLHALAWVGAGELLHRGSAWWLENQTPRGPRAWAAVAGAAVASLALPVGTLVLDGPGLLGPAARTVRLALTVGTADAATFGEWAVHASGSAVVTTLLPLLLLAVAARQITRGNAEPLARAATAFVAAALLLILGAVVGRVGHAGTAGAAFLVLLAVLTARTPRRGPFGGLAWSLATFVVLVPSLDLLLPKPAANDVPDVTEAELEVLVHRDLAHWLNQRAPEGGAVVLAPPATTSALHYFGSIRGLATPDPANQEGFGVAVRIAAASSTDEAEALLRKREVTHLVLPSWDKFMDEYARLGSNQPEKTLVALLNQWLPPRWLRPVPYALPAVDGLGDRHVVVFELTEVQDNVTALARLADYFIEMGQPEAAVRVAQALEQKFTLEPGALVARAQVAVAAGDRAALNELLRTLRPALDRAEDADLPWDRRVALAVVLAQGKQTELAKTRTRECLGSADEARLRQLSTRTLYQLQVLAKAYGLAIEDPALRAKARALLPAELQAKL